MFETCRAMKYPQTNTLYHPIALGWIGFAVP
jgi:hypothetical protein